MREKIGPYHVVDLAPGRRAWLNALDLSGPTHWMVGLLEVDVTVPRQIMGAHKARTGETLSFTGFLVSCLARAVDEDKTVQAYLKGRSQLVLFDDVNVGVMVEHVDGENSALMGHTIQGANRKSYRQIHDEIRAVQSAPVPPSRGMPAWFRRAMLLPWPFSRVVKAVMGMATRRDPTIRVAAAGTVFVTAVGMFGKGHSGWGIATTPHSLGLVVGSMAWKPAVVEGRVEPREILNLTVLFDHDVVDGAPATRFTRRLIELIESGCGLDEGSNGDKLREGLEAKPREGTSGKHTPATSRRGATG
ncbi:MAG: 2-oxo acid dehydrogenase subunit E2 [Candidatus Promineifilaceae bacterium]|nr:2-oxo acid dehydrogenase subunit E2 [Candidatus Promineifilaceae bacterium]